MGAEAAPAPLEAEKDINTRQMGLSGGPALCQNVKQTLRP